MPDEVNFVDLVALSRITSDTYAERFGGMINSSFFDASNILATLRQKGLVDFTTSFPGQSAVTVTDLGKKVLSDAAVGAAGEFGHLDFTILIQLSNGKRTIQDLSGAINIRPTDLAMHLYKLGQQQYLTYEFRNGMVTITLTEKGFVQAKNGMPQVQVGQVSQPAGAQQQAEVVQDQQPAQPGGTFQAAAGGTEQAAGPAGAQGQTIDINQLEANIRNAKRKKLYYVIIVAAVAVIGIVSALMLKLIRL